MATVETDRVIGYEATTLCALSEERNGRYAGLSLSFQ